VIQTTCPFCSLLTTSVSLSDAKSSSRHRKRTKTPPPRKYLNTDFQTVNAYGRR
jgi:hypothetical protein